MDSEAIYHYSRKLRRILDALSVYRGCDTAERFIEALKLSGLSNARLVYYADRLKRLLTYFTESDIEVAKATKEDCRRCLLFLLKDSYSGNTKMAYAQCLKRLIHFAKTEEIGKKDEDSDYVEEVKWVRPSQYAKKEASVTHKDILTQEELTMLFDAVGKVSAYPARDVPMLISMFEGAFRPGELLLVKIGGIEFKDRMAVVTTTGKTGVKTVPLILSYRHLLNWLNQHPYKGEPEAPVWWSFKTNGPITYGYLRELVKRTAERAGIRKRVWNYLLRHTRLTDVARKHPDQILKKFGNWKKGAEMMEVYVHLSNEDVENAVLKEHGLIKQEDESMLTLKSCPRCHEQNTIGVKRCVRCGLILDEELAIKAAHREGETLRSLVKRIEKLEGLDKKVDQIFDELLSRRTEKSSHH